MCTEGGSTDSGGHSSGALSMNCNVTEKVDGLAAYDGGLRVARCDKCEFASVLPLARGFEKNVSTNASRQMSQR